MPFLLYEAHKSGGEWKAFPIYPSDPPGSSVDTTHGRGDLILFDCGGIFSLITRAIGAAGSAVDTDNRMTRLITVRRGQLQMVAQLYAGESYEMDMRNAEGLPYLARWTHHEGTAYTQAHWTHL